MTSPENFGPQFKDHIQVYRGLPATIEGTDFSQVGIHWSSNKDVASAFATMGSMEETEHEGLVLHGSVDPKHVVQRGTPEWEDYAKHTAIHDDEDDPTGEQEITVRKGAPVTIHGYSVVKPDYSVSSKVDLPKPRKAKA